jgi:ABC-2 type transport system permease protein
VKYWQTLIRREFWEHRALWLAPLVVAGLLVVLTLLSGGVHISGDARVEIDGSEIDFVKALTEERAAKLFGVLIAGLYVPQLIVMFVVLGFYMLDALYSERKDRSILFWKSLPVSDAHTVLTKALVALVVVPLGVWLLSVVTSLAIVGSLSLKLGGGPLANLVQWNTPIWFGAQGAMFTGTLIAALWYAPIAAALLLISAWARRNVFLWAVLPPIGLMLLEETAFNTSHVARFIEYRFGGFFDAMGMGVNRAEPATGPGATDQQFAHIAEVYNRLDVTPLLANIDLWLGVAAAAAMLWLAMQIRRRRDDT